MKMIEIEVLKYVFIQMNNYQQYFKDISKTKWKKCTEIRK